MVRLCGPTDLSSPVNAMFIGALPSFFRNRKCPLLIIFALSAGTWDNIQERLRVLIEVYGGDSADVLEEELDRARIVLSKDIPGDVITMNSIVRIKTSIPVRSINLPLSSRGTRSRPIRYPSWPRQV